jgi:hypothetical protein
MCKTIDVSKIHGKWKTSHGTLNMVVTNEVIKGSEKITETRRGGFIGALGLQEYLWSKEAILTGSIRGMAFTYEITVKENGNGLLSGSDKTFSGIGYFGDDENLHLLEVGADKIPISYVATRG